MTFSVSPRVRELLVSSRDLVLSIYKRRPIEVGEELVVSEDGIQPMSDTVLPELVNWVTITELK